MALLILDPPPGSKVVPTRHETGVTLDFPLSEDGHLEARRRAWRTFEVGIFILVGCVAGFIVFRRSGLSVMMPMLDLVFVAGIVTLIAAASRMWAAWENTRGDDFLCQLAVVDNLLIRTWRDHRKEIWYRQEIRTVQVEDKLTRAARESEGGNIHLSTFAFQLVLELQSGEQIILLADGSSLPADEYRPKAEMEWIAAVLWQALAGGSTEGSQPAQQSANPSQAIQDLGQRGKETRISSDL